MAEWKSINDAGVVQSYFLKANMKRKISLTKPYDFYKVTSKWIICLI
jgi:hypothetical protein